MYEFFDHKERELAAREVADDQADIIEDKKLEEALAWAEEEERKEMETKQKADEEEWMRQEIAKNKEELGEDFGEDISLNFDE